MNLFETLKEFKNITPDPAFKENAKRAILAHTPRESRNIWQSVLAVFETGVAVALAVFFVLIITGQFPQSSPISPAQFSVINPATLRAEAQAVNIQIQLANINYTEPSTTVALPLPTASAESTKPAATTLPSVSSTSSQPTTVEGSASSSATSTVSIDQALQELAQ